MMQFYFPSSYRRAIKFAQRDAANEILRTEVLSRIASGERPLYIVTFPEALAEKVVSKKNLEAQTLKVRTGEQVDIRFVEDTLFAFGFKRVDYVYEPGQFAVRGSIVDVFSFSSEFPYRLDFFGDEVDSIRTFDVQTQLSKERCLEIAVVPEMKEGAKGSKVPFTDFLPADTVLVTKDLLFVRDCIEQTHQDGFAQQALLERQAESEMEEQELYEQLRRECQLMDGAQFLKGVSGLKRVEFGSRPTTTPDATLRFDLAVQPIFHKNFDLLTQALTEFRVQGYRLYILADSTTSDF